MAGVGASISHHMDYLIKRQGVVSSNIANSTTPGYISRDVKFTAATQAAQAHLVMSNPKHLGSAARQAAHKITEDRTHIRYDGNSVKIDEEMLKLQEIQLQYRLMTQLRSKHAGMYRMVLNGSGGGR